MIFEDDIPQQDFNDDVEAKRIFDRDMRELNDDHRDIDREQEAYEANSD